MHFDAMNATPTPTQAGLITLPKLTGGGARHFPTRTRCFFLANSSSRSTTLRPLTKTTRHIQILQPAMPSPVLFKPYRRLALKSMFDQFTEQVVRILLGLISWPKDLRVDPSKIRTQVITMIRDVASGHGNGSSGPKMSILDEYGTDLTKLAMEGKLDPVLVGREREMELLIQILEKRRKNCPCLIGKAGVGKTALVKRLAKLVADGVVPTLVGKKVIALDVGQLLVGTEYRGEVEEKVMMLISDVKERDDIILFIDYVETLIRAGSAHGTILATHIFETALAGGEFMCIGASRVEDDPRIEKMFRVVKVPEPTVDETIQILHGLREAHEIHHKVRYTDGSLVAAAQLSQEYISDCFLPDKAIRLIEEAGSFVKLRHYAKAQEETSELFNELRQIRKEKYETVRCQDFEKAKELRDREEEIRAQITALINNGKEESKAESEFVEHGPVVTEADIQHIVTLWTGMQVGKVSTEESARLLNMEEILHRRIIGQDEAVKAISKAIRRARVGLKDPNRPIGSFLFSGPNVVGNTELAKAVAAFYFGSEDALIHLDMSEFMEGYAVSKLIGSPPGYVGYAEVGQLTEAVRRRPHTVVLFDKIDKAHPNVFNLLFPILEDGKLTDSRGRVVKFNNCILIMTTHIGAALGISLQKARTWDESVFSSFSTTSLEDLFQIEFYGDFDGKFHKSLGLDIDLSAALLGLRSHRPPKKKEENMASEKEGKMTAENQKEQEQVEQRKLDSTSTGEQPEA